MPDVALRARNVERRFGGLLAVGGVSLEVRRGEIHAVIGPNGAGKSTLINLLSGDLAMSAGDVLLDGRSLRRLGPDRRGRLGLGRAYQKTTIFGACTAFENARLAAQARAGRALGLWPRRRTEQAIDRQAAAALAAVGLAERAAARAELLSHGEQRALEIAMVVAGGAHVLLLDEPLAGMGAEEARAITALIRTLKVGRAVLLVEHDMDAVFALADRLTVMADGRVIASGLPLEVRRDPHVRQAYLGDGESS